MSQDFTNEPMLIVPEVSHADAANGEAFGQLGTKSFNAFAPILANLRELKRMGLRHILADGSDDGHRLTFL